MADTPGIRGFAPDLAVAALVGAASLPLTRLFQRGPLGYVIVASIALSLMVSVVARRFRFPPLVAWAASMFGLVWFLTIAFFHTTLWGPFPTWASLESIGAAIRLGAAQTRVQVAPVESTVPLLMFAGAGIWLTTMLVHAAARWLRNPLEAIAGAVPLFAVAGTLVESDRLWFDSMSFLAASAVLLFVDHQVGVERLGAAGGARPGWRVGPALRLGLVALVIVAVFTPLVPGFGEPPGLAHTGGGGRVRFNPIVAIKPTLDNSVERELFTVRSPRPLYYRLTALDEFDGRTWRPSDRHTLLPLAGSPASFTGPRVDVTTSVTIGALAGPWLPAPYQAFQIADERANVEVETGALITTGEDVAAGSSYVVTSAVPDPTVDLLDRAVTYDRSMAPYLTLPSVPRRLREIANEIAGDQPNPYRKALALQSYLRTFRYDEDVAAGNGFNTIEEFLTEVKAGYCEQFAGSMAVLARILGVPSRVVIGFGNGYAVGTGTGEYRITTRHAHAWVEIYFPQAGWVTFEPTPRAGVALLPPYAAPAQNGQSPETNGSTTPDTSPTAEPSSNQPRRDIVEQQPQDGGLVAGGGLPVGWILLALLGAIVLAAGVIPLVGTLRRHQRLVRAREPAAHVAARYRDFLGWCEAAGVGRRSGETPHEHADRIAARFGEAAASLGSIARFADEALYAPPNGIDPAAADAAVAQARAAIGAGLPRRRRLAAALRIDVPVRRG